MRRTTTGATRRWPKANGYQFTRIYLLSLRDWILRHHERTGNDNDAIMRFEVVNLIAESPHLGEDDDYPVSEQLVLRYP